MKFIDLHTQYTLIKSNVLSKIEDLLDDGNYIMGPQVALLEQELADYTKRRHCITCSSGTDALLIPLMAMDIGTGDAVFVPSFTFFATAEVVAFLGATPIFVDINPLTFNIDSSNLEFQIERVIKEGRLKPKLIIPVDLFGLPADYNEIQSIASKYNMNILEDAAQGFGGIYWGNKAGTFGSVSATSFYPAKPLGCYGDGGAIFTDDDELFRVMSSIRVHGHGSDKYNNERIGINGRLDTIQAVVLIEKLKLLDKEIELRNMVAQLYSKYISSVKTPVIPDGSISSWAQYSVLADNDTHRKQLMDSLKEKDVPSVIYYPVPLHLQGAFAGLNYKKGSLPVTEDICSRVFSLPMHPYLTEAEIKFIADIINN